MVKIILLRNYNRKSRKYNIQRYFLLTNTKKIYKGINKSKIKLFSSYKINLKKYRKYKNVLQWKILK